MILAVANARGDIHYVLLERAGVARQPTLLNLIGKQALRFGFIEPKLLQLQDLAIGKLRVFVQVAQEIAHAFRRAACVEQAILIEVQIDVARETAALQETGSGSLSQPFNSLERSSRCLCVR